jgi:hypothetical protein
MYCTAWFYSPNDLNHLFSFSFLPPVRCVLFFVKMGNFYKKQLNSKDALPFVQRILSGSHNLSKEMIS